MNRHYYFNYYLVSVILIFFSIFYFFVNQIIKEYLIIISLTIFFFTYLFEGYLNIKSHNLILDKENINSIDKEQILKKKIYEKKGKKWDSRSIFQIYEDLKKINKNITVSYNPSYIKDYELDLNIYPLSGISNVETILCNENGYYAIYKSDRYGFNNPNEEWDANEIEYLLVGDSFLQGYCVNRPDDIASVLRNLSNKSVLNLGFGGNGPLLEFATLKEYINKNVKKVIWVFYEENDIINLESEIKNKFLYNYFKIPNFTQNLKYRQNEINYLVNQFIEKEKNNYKINSNKNLNFDILKFLKLHKVRNFLFTKNFFFKKEEEINNLTNLKKILQMSKKLLNQNNQNLYFVYLPNHNNFKTNKIDDHYYQLQNITNSLGIPFIDIYKSFKNEKNPLDFFPFKLGGHYNVDGYKKIAEIIYKFTKD